MTLTAPDVGISRDLARLASTVHAQEPDRAAFRRLVDGVERALAAPVPAALSALAAEIGGPAGDLPLLGTGLRAGGHEALQWNAVRCGAAEIPDVALLIAGLATTGDVELSSAASHGELSRAVSAGRAVARAAEALLAEPLVTDAVLTDAPVRPSYGVLGVAVTCALLSGVAEEDLAVVLDLAASLMVTAGPADGDVALLVAGHVCAAGRLAVLIWRAGVTPLPGAGFVFGAAVCAGLDRAALTADLGTRWEIVNSYFKPYPCARWLHPALDALSRALDEAPGTAATMAELTIETFAFAVSLDDPDPTSDMHARFSLPYCAAALAHDGFLDAASFLPENLGREEVRELARRARLVEVSEYTAALPVQRPARVTVRRTDGRQASAEVPNARGNPDTPLSESEIIAKFRRNVGDHVTSSLAEDAAAALLSPRQDRPGRVLAALAAQL